ncbi:MAG: asparagine-linked glycosylation protein [Chaenotheca gracillima]|nr:MAG: asparagine-linked glycosylation protein [Chaenotheca gracillima]
MRSLHSRLLLGILSLLIEQASADLPYNPTRVFLPSPPNNDLAYVLAPQASSSSAMQLLTLNISTTLDASSLPFSTLSASLPFLNGKSNVAVTPVVDHTGNISVYAGDCSIRTNGSSLWRFVFDKTSLQKGQWVEQTEYEQPKNAGARLPGANFLASGVSFSSQVNKNSTPDSSFYFFGGMCPTANSPSSDSWTAAANYSNSMLKLTAKIPATSPGTATSPPSTSPLTFGLNIIQSRGPPIAEAGFSITSLQTSVMNSSTGVETQQQNYVLVGGHTPTAFINMSQVALFSLPEESWTFIPIDSPTTSGTSSSASQQQLSSGVEPRSGHSAVLTSDGKRVIIFGGWVGDIDTPAQPQLAVLDLGDGYGGDGDWKWEVPDATGPTLDSGAGIYGHGAVMLPGDVMMVLGGYSIPASKKTKSKRAQSTPSTKTYFFNTTSNAWTTNYASPDRTDVHSASKASGPLSRTSQKAALGSGLSIGLAAIVGLVLLWLWYSRRLKKQKREAREKELRALGYTAQRLNGLGDGAVPQMDYVGTSQNQPEMRSLRWSTNSQVGGFGEGPGWQENGGSQAERTGLLMEIPSPTRGLRRSLHSRSRSERTNPYQLAPGYDDNRLSLAGSIHPIDERDEYEQPVPIGTAIGDPQMAEANVMNTAPMLDPFRDPDPLGSHPVSIQTSPASPSQERELEIGRWVSDWEVADAMMHSGAGRLSPGRVSPDKDRTSSTLSNVSARSNVSAVSQPYSFGTVSRSISQRSAAFFNSGVNPFASTNTSPTFDQPSAGNAGGSESPQHRRARSMSMFSQGSNGSQALNNASFVTASSTFPQLQAEGESLLPRPGDPSPPDSPIKSSGRTQARRSTGWMGSMRRALPFTNNGAERSPSPGSRSSSPSKSGSPTRSEGNSPSPRRAASAGAMYWRTKQGAADWDVTSDAGPGSRGRAPPRAPGEEDEDWDVEAAVENRVVQLMFTVPKEKLRVVNAAAGETGMGSDDDDDDNHRGLLAKSPSVKGKDPIRNVDRDPPGPDSQDETLSNRDVSHRVL